MKVTPQELNERLSWSLDQKIDHSLGAIEQFYNYSKGKVYTSFSGGKDSVVLRYLVRYRYPNVETTFLNTTNEFPEIYRFLKTMNDIRWVQPEMNLKQVIEKVGFPMVSKEQAQYIREARHTKSKKLMDIRMNGKGGNSGKISEKWKFLIKAPFEISEKCCHYLKKKPAKKYEKETGLMPIIGTLTSESQLRKMKYYMTGCNDLESKRKGSYPLSIWTTNDIWEFIRKNNIPYCPIYDTYDDKNVQTGCMGMWIWLPP